MAKKSNPAPDAPDRGGLTRRQWMSLGAAGTAALVIPGCRAPGPCRATLVGLAGRKRCPHRFCRYYTGAGGAACGAPSARTGRTA